MRHVLTSVLGAREQVDVHVSEHDLSGGEMILLCSDGLHGVMADDELHGMLSAGGTPAEIVPQLIDAALTRGARDNVTAVLVRFRGE
jgi:protein phosphatase